MWPLGLMALLAVKAAPAQTLPTNVRMRMILECVAELRVQGAGPDGASSVARECMTRKETAWRAAARGEVPPPPAEAGAATGVAGAGAGTEPAGTGGSAEFFALQASIDFLPSGMPKPTPEMRRYCDSAARDRRSVSVPSRPLGWSLFIQAEPMVLDWAMQQLPGCSAEPDLLARSWLEALRQARATRIDVGPAERLSRELLDRAKAINARRVAALQPLPPEPGRMVLGQQLGQPLPYDLCEPEAQVAYKTTRTACLSSSALKMKDPRATMLIRRVDHLPTLVSRLPRTGQLALWLPQHLVQQASDEYGGQRVLVIDGVLHGVGLGLQPRSDFLAQMVRLYGEPRTSIGTVFNQMQVVHQFHVPGGVLRVQCQRTDATCSYAEAFTPAGERFMSQDLMVALRDQFAAKVHAYPAQGDSGRSVARQYSDALETSLEMNRQLDAQRQQAIADQQRREQEESQRRQREWEEQQRRQQQSY